MAKLFVASFFPRSTIEIALTVGARSFRKIRGVSSCFYNLRLRCRYWVQLRNGCCFPFQRKKKKSSARAFEVHASAFVLFIWQTVFHRPKKLFISRRVVICSLSRYVESRCEITIRVIKGYARSNLLIFAQSSTRFLTRHKGKSFKD